MEHVCRKSWLFIKGLLYILLNVQGQTRREKMLHNNDETALSLRTVDDYIILV